MPCKSNQIDQNNKSQNTNESDRSILIISCQSGLCHSLRIDREKCATKELIPIKLAKIEIYPAARDFLNKIIAVDRPVGAPNKIPLGTVSRRYKLYISLAPTFERNLISSNAVSAVRRIAPTKAPIIIPKKTVTPTRIIPSFDWFIMSLHSRR